MTDQANPRDRVADALTATLIDRGLLIEAGWEGLRAMILPPDAPQIQLVEMRKAFFAGAQHLYASIMNVLDPGEYPTEADMRRLSLIHDELQAFGRELVRQIKTEGPMQ